MKTLTDIALATHLYYEDQGISFVPPTLNIHQLIQSNCFVIYHHGFVGINPFYRGSICLNAELRTIYGTSYKLEPLTELDDFSNLYYHFQLDRAQAEGVDGSSAKILSHVFYCKIKADPLIVYPACSIVSAPKNAFLFKKRAEDFSRNSVSIRLLQDLEMR